MAGTERHVTDEEIQEASGHAPRVPGAAPRATCLTCGEEHVAFYATMAHDCLVEFAKDGKPVRNTYAHFLLFFQRLGFGVLRTPQDLKFPPSKVITARVALTQHLQSDLNIGAAYTLSTWYGEHNGFEHVVSPDLGALT